MKEEFDKLRLYWAVQKGKKYIYWGIGILGVSALLYYVWRGKGKSKLDK